MPEQALPELMRIVRRRMVSIGHQSRMAPDRELVTRWRDACDESAFELLVWRHGSMVLSTCERILGPSADADDAFQATFLALVQKIQAIRSDDCIGGWLYRIAYRMAIRLKAQRLGVAESPREPAIEPDLLPMWNDLRLVLDEEINRLPEKYRSVFVMCHLQGMTNRQAAREINCPVGTVLSRLSTARERLRLRLSKRGVTLSLPALGVVLAATSRACSRDHADLAIKAFLGQAPDQVNQLAQGVIPMWSLSRIGSSMIAGTFGLAFLLLASITSLTTGDEPKTAVKTEKTIKTEKAGKQTPMMPESWGGGPFGMGDYEFGIDTQTKKQGKASAYIMAKTPGQGATLTQAIDAKEYAGKRIRYSAFVKTADASGAGLWMRADTSKGAGAFDNMQNRMIKGDTDWKEIEVVLDIPAEAKLICFGIINFGKGTVWIDNIVIKEVGKEVKPTAENPKLGDQDIGMEFPAAPAQPENLDFENGVPSDDLVEFTDAEKARLKSKIVEFKTPVPRQGFDDLQGLKQIIGDARIVQLGEGTHGTREHFQMKHRLLEYFVTELGFTHFVIEANMPEARRVNDYVLTGKGKAREALAGMYFWTWNTEEVLDMIEWMRDYNKTAKTKVQFFGNDMQFASYAVTQTLEFIKKVDPEYLPTAQANYDKLKPLMPNSPGEYDKLKSLSNTDRKELSALAWKVVQHLEKQRDQIIKKSTGEQVDDAIQDARVVAQAVSISHSSFSYRDECMAENTSWILDHAPKGSKVVVWAHNLHVCRRPGAMGSFLHKKYGAQMRTFGFASREGTYTAIKSGVGLTSDNLLAKPPLASLEAKLDLIGVPNFILDLRTAATDDHFKWLQSTMPMRNIGALAMDLQFSPSKVHVDYDAVIYIAKTTASKCFGITKAK